MKKPFPLLALLSAAFLLLTAPSQASAQCCSPCNTYTPCCGSFEAGVHALLFKPLICRWDYAHSFDKPARRIRKMATLDPDLHWGVRIFGKYKRNCTYVYLGYQWFSATEKELFKGPHNLQARDLWYTGQEAHTRLSWRYQNVDLRLGSERNMCCALVRRYVNVRWVDLCYRRRLDFLLPTDFIPYAATPEQIRNLPGPLGFTSREKAGVHGVALGLGTGANWDLWCGLGLLTDFNVLGLIASNNTHAQCEERLTDPRYYDTSYDSVTTITPELNFRLGIDYHWCCGCWNIVGEIGYELDYFWNAIHFAREVNEVKAIEQKNEWTTACEDVGFSGLFFGVRALF